MTINKNYLSAMMAGIAFSMSMGAQASMGNLGTTYGVLPTDVATAQGLSMFNTQMSSLYYNPSYMVKDPHGGLTAGLMHAAPSLQLESQGGAAPLSRDGGNVLNNTPSQHVLLGMKTNLSSLTTMQHPVYFGVVVGVEKYGMEMLAFESGTSSEGQFLEYDRQPLFLLLGGATNLWRGIDVGASARVTLHAESKLSATSTLAGVTSNEKLGVSAKPDIRPTAGLTIDWGKTVCPENGCFLSGFETAFTYRSFSNTKTSVDATVIVPQTVDAPGLALNVLTIDSYQPNIYSAGLLYGSDHHYRISVSAEMQEWSSLGKELEKDTIKSVAINTGGLKFKDIIVPRIGGEYWFNRSIMVSGGLAMNPTPIDSKTSADINYLDADKLVAGLGLTLELQNPPILAFPLRIDIGYQYQQLMDKEFSLTASKKISNSGVEVPAYTPYENVKVKGDVSVLSAAISLKF